SQTSASAALPITSPDAIRVLTLRFPGVQRSTEPRTMPAHQEQHLAISARQSSPRIPKQHAASVRSLHFYQFGIGRMLGRWSEFSHPDCFLLFEVRISPYKQIRDLAWIV